MRKVNLKIPAAVGVLLMALAGPARAVTHYVSPGQSIQAAIDDANDGDEIEVAPGTYYEAINFNDKAIHLYSTAGPNDTTIDGTGNYHVVQCISGEDANTILEGFTITGGNANGVWPDDSGGGMYNERSSPTVKNCIFTGNHADGYGGGMYSHVYNETTGGSPTVINCIFHSNTAANGGGICNHWYVNAEVTDCTFSLNTVVNCGGGMYNSQSSSTVTNCTFSGNSASWDGGGMCNYQSSPTLTDCTFIGNKGSRYCGGMHNEDNSNPTVTNCIFSANSDSAFGGGMSNLNSSPIVTSCNFSNNTGDEGSGMYNFSSSPTVTNCTFRGNSADLEGGGMNNKNSSPMVTNCTFRGNTAGYYEGGGGMYNSGGNPRITNCTFIGNSAPYGGGMSNYGIVTNCILWGNSAMEGQQIYGSAAVTYSDVEGGWGGIGNIDADPCFIDAVAGNLRLRPNSLCIDAGNNTAVPASVLKDLAGRLRFADDPCTPDTGKAGTTGRPVVDMGAYEFQGCGHISQNLMANPGFELGDATGWITNWGFSLTADTNQVHDGIYSGLASNRTASWQGAWQSLLGLMDDSKTYRVSGWVRLQNEPNDYVALIVTQTDSAGTQYRCIDNATGHNDQWVHLDGTLALDIVGQLTALYVYFEGPAPGVNFYVDDAAVTEVMGDMNHNGGVDFIDFSLFASYYGFDCSTQDCGRANLNDCDNTINVLDLVIFCNNWLAGTEPEL